MKKNIFASKKRIRLGIWGLGRGMHFYSKCQQLHLDIVAGCDYNEHMRKDFLRANPEAFASADAGEFLKQDFDAVLLASFCPNHAADAIRCLRAGKHVLSEVTAFHTMADGVALVEEVEKSGRIYNLAENYPFTAANSYLTRKWKEGLFGELMYAEFEYVHNLRALQYSYNDGVPVQPGHTLHNWRSWMNMHYYCTHSIGPIMVISGTRPTRVVSLPADRGMAGFIYDGQFLITPSLINMSNGAVVRNLMGHTTNDTHVQRIWGTLGSAEISVGKELQLRLGGDGGDSGSQRLEVKPHWGEFGEIAAKTGHGGSDFWVLYYFARQILTGETAPFDIYSAADVTTPGILALRSALEGGKPYDVPDFRDKAQRAAWRKDTWAQKRLDPATHAFGPGADKVATADFSRTMSDLCNYVPKVRAYTDWRKLEGDMLEKARLVDMIYPLVAGHAAIVDAYHRARKLAEAFPGSEGARVINEMLAVGLEKELLKKDSLAKFKREAAALRRRYPHISAELLEVQASALQPKPKNLAGVEKPGRGVRLNIPAESSINNRMWFVCHIHKKSADGLIYIRGKIDMPGAGKGTLLYGADGPVRVWVNGEPAGCQPRARNPVIRDQYRAVVEWRKGKNEVLFALDTKHGHSWGVCACGELRG